MCVDTAKSSFEGLACLVRIGAAIKRDNSFDTLNIGSCDKARCVLSGCEWAGRCWRSSVLRAKFKILQNGLEFLINIGIGDAFAALEMN